MTVSLTLRSKLRTHDNGAVGRSVWLSDRMEPPEIVQELFGSAPLPHMNPVKDFTFEFTTTLAQRAVPEYRKQRNTFGTTWVSDPSARWAMRSYEAVSLLIYTAPTPKPELFHEL